MKRQQATAPWELARAERRRHLADLVRMAAIVVGIISVAYLTLFLLWLVG